MTNKIFQEGKNKYEKRFTIRLEMYEELEKTFWKNGKRNDWQSQKESKPYSSLREKQIKAAHYHLSPINYQESQRSRNLFQHLFYQCMRE